jgi:hypothetical protein
VLAGVTTRSPAICPARTHAWWQIDQAERVRMAKDRKSHGARLIVCPTCKAKPGKECNAVRRDRL